MLTVAAKDSPTPAHIIEGGEKQASGENNDAKSSTHPNFIRAVSRVFASSTDSLRSSCTSWFGCWLCFFFLQGKESGMADLEV